MCVCILEYCAVCSGTIYVYCISLTVSADLLNKPDVLSDFNNNKKKNVGLSLEHFWFNMFVLYIVKLLTEYQMIFLK